MSLSPSVRCLGGALPGALATDGLAAPACGVGLGFIGFVQRAYGGPASGPTAQSTPPPGRITDVVYRVYTAFIRF